MGENVGASDGRHLRAQSSVSDTAAGRTNAAPPPAPKAASQPTFAFMIGYLPQWCGGRAIPVDLCIEVVPIEPLRAVPLVVRSRLQAGSAAESDPGSFGKSCSADREELCSLQTECARSRRLPCWTRIVDDGVVCGKIAPSLICRGTVNRLLAPWRSRTPSQPPKKKSLFRTNGTARGSAKDIVQVLRLRERVEEILGLQRSVVVQSQAEPWKLFVPDLVMTVIRRPRRIPALHRKCL